MHKWVGKLSKGGFRTIGLKEYGVFVLFLFYLFFLKTDAQMGG